MDEILRIPKNIINSHQHYTRDTASQDYSHFKGRNVIASTSLCAWGLEDVPGLKNLKKTGLSIRTKV